MYLYTYTHLNVCTEGYRSSICVYTYVLTCVNECRPSVVRGQGAAGFNAAVFLIRCSALQCVTLYITRVQQGSFAHMQTFMASFQCANQRSVGLFCICIGLFCEYIGLFCICAILFRELPMRKSATKCRARLHMYRLLLQRYIVGLRCRDVQSTTNHGALLRKYRALLRIYRALLRRYAIGLSCRYMH